jgi:hypothetical protein
LLGQPVAQLGIVVDDQDLARIRHSASAVRFAVPSSLGQDFNLTCADPKIVTRFDRSQMCRRPPQQRRMQVLQGATNIAKLPELLTGE